MIAPTGIHRSAITAMVIKQLAIASAAFPTDASALEASISALRSSISALDNSIKTLEGSSGRWETAAWCCAILVGIGIVGELVVIVSEYRDDLHDWRRGAGFWAWRVVLPPDRPPRWRFWFDIVATILVLAGVFGEAGASMKLGSINNQLRLKTSVLRAKSDELLALITQEAGSAADSAKRAQGSADAAGKMADSVHKKVDAVGKQADGIDQELAMAQFLLEPRKVFSPTGLKIQFAPFKGKTILFRSYFNDSDGYFLCSELVDVANAAEVVAVDGCNTVPVKFPISLGINVFAPDEKTMLALNQIMAGVTPFGSAGDTHVQAIVVFVGRKNTFHVGETAQTRDAQKRATAMKKTERRKASPQ